VGLDPKIRLNYMLNQAQYRDQVHKGSFQTLDNATIHLDYHPKKFLQKAHVTKIMIFELFVSTI